MESLGLVLGYLYACAILAGMWFGVRAWWAQKDLFEQSFAFIRPVPMPIPFRLDDLRKPERVSERDFEKAKRTFRTKTHHGFSFALCWQ
jgi:hypothetical protein